MFPSDNTEIPEGTVVSLTGEGPKVEPSKRAGDEYMIGVVTQTTGVEVSNGTFDGVRVAIAGRVSVRVSAANGIIHVGDYLTSSGVDGVAIKANVGSPIIGRALSEYDGEEEGNVVLFLSSMAPWGGNSVLTAADASTSTEDRVVVSGKLLLSGGLEIEQVGSSENLSALFTENMIFANAKIQTDTVGFATVEANNQAVSVKFSEPYLYEPAVNVTINLMSGDSRMEQIFGSDVRYIVTNKSPEGFTISLNKVTEVAIPFAWMSLAVRQDKTEKHQEGVVTGGEEEAEDSGGVGSEQQAEGEGEEVEEEVAETELSEETIEEVAPIEVVPEPEVVIEELPTEAVTAPTPDIVVEPEPEPIVVSELISESETAPEAEMPSEPVVEESVQ
jgi:hypothetical protein